MLRTAVQGQSENCGHVQDTTRMALVVEYDGTRYLGFQLQTGGPTIQGELEQALRRLTGERVRVAAAGRTDAGVHARGQVVSFLTASSLSREAFMGGLNHYLPADVAVRAADTVSHSFDPRRDAVSRQYRYSFLCSRTRSPLNEGFTCRVLADLDVEEMNRACEALRGEHDFASFASGISGETKSTVRTVYRAEVSRDGDRVHFHITANGFLRHQVRSAAGCLARIGLGKMGQEEFRAVIAARRPGTAGPTLPARGLCLMGVRYPFYHSELTPFINAVTPGEET